MCCMLLVSSPFKHNGSTGNGVTFVGTLLQDLNEGVRG